MATNTNGGRVEVKRAYAPRGGIMVDRVGHGYCPSCRSGQRNAGTECAGRIRTRGLYLTCLRARFRGTIGVRSTGRSSDLRLRTRLEQPSRGDRRSGTSARAPRRIQQRPCAGFSPASLFIRPRERAEPVGARNHIPFPTTWPEGTANHRRILRAITARLGIAPFWRRNSVRWESEIVRSSVPSTCAR
jgi:hypothetical protein